jgi:hypothetical protein
VSGVQSCRAAGCCPPLPTHQIRNKTQKPVPQEPKKSVFEMPDHGEVRSGSGSAEAPHLGLMLQEHKQSQQTGLLDEALNSNDFGASISGSPNGHAATRPDQFSSGQQVSRFST